MENKTINKVIKFIGVVFTLVSLWYVSILVHGSFAEIGDMLFDNNSFWLIIFGLLLYGITQINAVITWFLLLRDDYKTIPFRDYYVILAKSQIGKYIPGNFSHILGRSYLSKLSGMKISDVAKSIFIETVLLLYVGFLVGSAYFLFFDNLLFGYSGFWFSIIIIGFTVCILGFMSKMNSPINIWRQGRKVSKILLLNSLSFVALGCIFYVAQIFLYGGSVGLIQFIIIAAVSFIAGFIMPGSPAGIGVREYVFISLLSSQMQIEVALTLALLFRIITVLGDILFFMSSFAINKKVPHV